MNHNHERFALVTGASGGIGRAICAELKSDGYSIIGLDQEVSRQHEEAFIEVDLAKLVSDPACLKQVREQVDSILDGRVFTLLVNNAAIQIIAPFSNLSNEDWLSSMQVNVIAPAVLSRELLPQLEKGGGKIVNVSSIHADLTKSEFACYATTKAALNGLTRAMAVELGARVQVNAVCPAAVATPMLEAGFVENTSARARLAAAHPVGHIGTPGDIARAVVFLARPENGFISGACLEIDGAISSRLHDPL